MSGWLEILLFVSVLSALTPLTGRYMAHVFTRPPGRFERALGLDRMPGQDWKGYARSVLCFSIAGSLVLYAIVRAQGAPWDLSFNTAASFVSNTNWQYYAGESTLSNVAQMTGPAVQNFLSAATGIAVLVAFVRGLAARSGTEIGAFYVDLTRAIVFILLPLSALVALVFVSQGVIQSLDTGPVASQEAIKLLGTNGGGFFNVNSAHPYENPTWLSNFVQMLAILLIPAGLTATYGRMVGNRRQGWMVFGAMMALFVTAVALIYVSELGPTPAMQAAGLDGGNLEGKEMRFGIGSSSLFAAVTTAASAGAVNAAMESFSGFGGAVPMAQMMTGEVVWGGVGSGLSSMLLFVILGVFVAGLMVGRTPELLGKKIEAREVKLTIAGTIAAPLLVLAATALAIGTRWGTPSIAGSGPQGFSETLYAYVSQGNNNGSAFAGYTGFVQPNGTNDGAFGISFADVLGALAMLGGRFLPMLAVLAIAGSLAGKRVSPAGLGTLRTDTVTFGVLLVAVVLIVALLTFVPALLLGPVVQGLSEELY